MAKLYVWFNTSQEYVYLKFCKSSDYTIGSYNQHNDLLLDILEYYNENLYSMLSYSQKYRLACVKRDKRNIAFINKLINKINGKE